MKILPPEWTGHRRPRRMLFGVLYLGALAALALTAAGWQLLYDDAGQAVFFGALAVFLGHLAALCLFGYRGTRRRPGTSGIRRTAAGLIFPYAGGATYLVAATLFLTTAAAAGYATVAAQRGTWLIAALFGVIALPLLVLLIVILRMVPGEVVIGPRGVHHRGLTFTHFIPWIALTSATPVWRRGPMIAVSFVGSPDTRSRDFLGRPMTTPETISGRWLAADPGMVLGALKHYIAHPEHRWELTTDAAMERITGEGEQRP
ncbi:hypothetical protein Aab01nite_65860 [Paractinoplanes abujensis]|uniref:Uncharacterized protein n=1 Tax=Paractinoplanes abujensis TaxID=882441 RepID=A0A7W7CPU6_9ACTN|nr:hypothetical protein [Actinoplanes abujensis]MBB4692507.1 hypothetical protein [Actinoplanes abujensis]GID22996.1 hypothetical protein Aab01nite_65860 [Actinoplanes abujensis]